VVKNIMQCIVVLVGILFVSIAVASDKVVVIPLSSAKKLMNVVTVSAKGGDFTSPVAAINSITDAAADNPYLVFIGPGVYTLTQTLFMKPFVTITGSGQEATILTGAISTGANDASSALVSGADNAILRDLTVENNGGSTYSIALFNSGSSPIIQDITISASGGTIVNYGVRNFSSSPVMTDVTATAFGGNTSYGVYNSSSSPIMTGVTATASDGTSSSIGVSDMNSSSIIRHCTLEGSFGIKVSTSGTTKVMHSSIIGTSLLGSGATLTCVNSDNGDATELGPDCKLP